MVIVGLEWSGAAVDRVHATAPLSPCSLIVIGRVPSFPPSTSDWIGGEPGEPFLCERFKLDDEIDPLTFTFFRISEDISVHPNDHHPTTEY